MDVVALAQYGIGYAVATTRHGDHPWQVQKPAAAEEMVIYCFDRR